MFSREGEIVIEALQSHAILCDGRTITSGETMALRPGLVFEANGVNIRVEA